MYARPVEASSPTPLPALRAVVRALRRDGVDAVLDHAVVARSQVNVEAARLRQAIVKRMATSPPDILHAHGRVAALAAIGASRGLVPVVVTFDEAPGLTALEADLATRADAVVARSSSERDAWSAQRFPLERVHVVPLAAEVPPGIPEEGAHDVVTDAHGAALDRLVRSLGTWPRRRLVVVTPLSRTEREHVLALAAALGVGSRVEVNPLRRAASRGLWTRAALVVAGPDGSRHGDLVIEAAAHGVPAVAPDLHAFSDVVVAGATGVLVPADAGPREVGRAVGELLADDLRLRGYGLAAQLRARAMHDPEHVARRIREVYEALVLDRLGEDEDDAPEISGTDRERTALVIEHLPVARRIAHRYAGRGQAIGDLVQVASLGLVKAARRFDPEQGTDFLSYAVPTMLGELRRYFRDNAWAMHVPRGLQETALRVQQADETLRQRLGHEASAVDVAGDLGVRVDDVLEARQVSGIAFSCRSLDAPLSDEAGNGLAELVGGDDVAMEQVEDREALQAALARVPEREREILVLRFFGERTQTEIAERLGISQMHVSRLLAKTLRTLREHVVDGVPLPASWPSPLASSGSRPAAS
jgi:RNA polymerase sigma-B factor